MTPAEYKPGLSVWYEPSPGVRFLGETVDDAPRKCGDTWVATIAMPDKSYGIWRLGGQKGTIRMSVPAAALDCLEVVIVDQDPVPLPGLFEGIRVRWFSGSGDVYGTIIKVWSDGRLDVESDSGNRFERMHFGEVRLDRKAT